MVAAAKEPCDFAEAVEEPAARTGQALKLAQARDGPGAGAHFKEKGGLGQRLTFFSHGLSGDALAG